MLQIKILSSFLSSKTLQRALKLVIFAGMCASTTALRCIWKPVWYYTWLRRLASSFPALPYSTGLFIPPSPHSVYFVSTERVICLHSACCHILHALLAFSWVGPLACLALDLQLPCLSDCGSTGCTHQDWGSSGTAKDTNGNEGPEFSGLYQILSIP